MDIQFLSDHLYLQTVTRNRLALFDFDGTITTKDTLIEFIRYYHGNTKLLTGFLILSPILVSYKVGIIPNWKAKEILLRYFFHGEPVSEFNEKCTTFAKICIPKLLRPQAINTIETHLKNNDEVVVVSASPENWVKPWCDAQNIKCLATQLEISNDIITGKISGKNCHGPEKVTRIKSCLELSSFDEIFAYGDTSGDKPMLALAHRKYYKPFRG